uniref:G-protein coupled receptors family 1 profile domain-containing protein n=1 Tax=Globodera rostochiensis TaxID=31243 RepID=A0A914I746_GLORO
MRFLTVDELNRKCPRDGLPTFAAINGTIAEDQQRWLSHPFDDNCIRSFFLGLSAQLRRYEPWEEWFYTAMYALISALALIGNGMVILSVIRKRSMRTARNVFIVNLALSNLMLALTTVPFLWLPSIDFDFPYSNFFCKFANALPGSNIYCSTLTISVMAIDRYYSVRSLNISSSSARPGQCGRALIISFLIWFFSFLLSFPLIVYYRVHVLYVIKDIYVYKDTSATGHSTSANFSSQIVLQSYGWSQCRLSTGEDEQGKEEMEMSSPNAHNSFWLIVVDERMVQLGMAAMQAVMLYAVPLVVLSIFNMKLTRFLKMNAKQLKQNTERECDSVGVAMERRRQRGGSKASSMGGVTQRSSIATSELMLPRQVSIVTIGASSRAAEKRSNRTTALLIAMAGSYAVLWLPFTLVSILIDLDWLGVESGSPIVERIDQTCKLLSITSICVNPFLYGFLNTNFRHEFNEIFSYCLAWMPTLTMREGRQRRQRETSSSLGADRKSIPQYSAIVSKTESSTHQSIGSGRRPGKGANIVRLLNE